MSSTLNAGQRENSLGEITLIRSFEGVDQTAYAIVIQA